MYIGLQDKYKTVAEALQAAVVSLLKDDEMKYKRSFFYWAAFISHGFASVKLDDALLGKIHDRIKAHYGDAGEPSRVAGEEHGIEVALVSTLLNLTRDAYHRLEDSEETLSRKWSEKMGRAMSGAVADISLADQ